MAQLKNFVLLDKSTKWKRRLISLLENNCTEVLLFPYFFKLI